MQYTAYSCTVTNGSPTVTGHTNCRFLANAAAGNAFKIKDDAVIYTIASVTSDNVLVLSAPFQGTTGSSKQYQITRDYTATHGLAEINVGDQDWPIHLTQEVIRKIDAKLPEIANGTFTPIVAGATTAGVGTYSRQVGRYNKIGSRVFFTLEVTLTAHTGTGLVTITGLPFTSNSAINFHPCDVAFGNITSAGGGSMAVVLGGTSTIKLGESNISAGLYFYVIDGNAQYCISGSYEV
jgi:hypothetical protein